MEVSSAKISKQGDRDYNEDYAIICSREERYLFVVADGLGGHGRGDEASMSVCKSSEELFADSKTDVPQIFEVSQNRLIKLQQSENCNQGMKTTMNLLLIEDGKAKWGHVGDTRTYYFHRGRLKKRTYDHSVPQMLVSAGEIREKDIRNHPDRNRLLKVMGTPWDKAQYQIEKEISISKNQVFLICTDGFWEYIDEKSMAKCLKKAKTPEEWLSAMELTVKANGAGHDMDNYTAIAVWIN